MFLISMNERERAIVALLLLSGIGKDLSRPNGIPIYAQTTTDYCILYWLFESIHLPADATEKCVRMIARKFINIL